MYKKHAFFVVLALAVAVNQFVLSTPTVDEKSEVVDRDEERGGEEAVKLMGETIAKTMTQLEKTIVVPEHVNPTGQILSEGEQGALPQAIRHEGNPPQNIFKLFGATIASPNLVPEAVAQRTSQGNIRNQLADDLETTAAEKVGRGVKRKVSSPDEAQRRQINDAQRKVQTVRAKNVRPRKKVRPLTDLIRVWRIDATKVEERKKEIFIQLARRKEEILRHKLPDKLHFTDDEVDCMAIGSIYFDRKLKELDKSARGNRERLNEELVNLDGDRLKQLGVDPTNVEKRAFDMFHNEVDLPYNKKIVYMAIGKEFYESLHPSGVST